MKNYTCLMEECNEAIKARGLCVKHYDRARLDGSLESVAAASAWHRVSNVDAESMTGTCSQCGEVPVAEKASNGRWACWFRVTAARRGIPVSEARLLAPQRRRPARLGTANLSNSKKGDRERFDFYGWEVTEMGCWDWSGPLKTSGYGLFYGSSFGTKEAHRVSYQLHFGAIPKGLAVHHTCSNRKCVNPIHLQAVTPSANTAEMLQRRALTKKIAELKREVAELKKKAVAA